MNNPELVRIEPDKVTIDRIRQVIYFPAMSEKIPLLIGLLRATEAHRTMVFVNTRRMAEKLEGALRANGLNAQALSGDVPQPKRLKFLRAFHEGELAVLIATDVASRGLHITSRTSSTTTCRRTPPTTCIASAAPRVPAPTATRSASAARNMRSRCRTSRPTSATRFRSSGSCRNCCRRSRMRRIRPRMAMAARTARAAAAGAAGRAAGAAVRIAAAVGPAEPRPRPQVAAGRRPDGRRVMLQCCASLVSRARSIT
jgi:hypothetical protein